ncbi:MAG: YggS family pyridoxal phosphate-dependent enzyme [Tissierellia bacterium]|nr:YggS family pyridoxal phosphate-dependent enzyme [Tissierellia bacterium]
MSVKNNIYNIRENIELAKQKSGRKDDVMLLCVTKMVDYDLIDQALEEGLVDIAENKVQELVKRMDHYGEAANYHMIGRMQTNKVKYIYDKVKLIHSLDSIKLAKEINKRALNSDMIVDVLVQVNASKESTKTGIFLENLDEFIYDCLELTNIRIRGLMTMAPDTEDEKLIRTVFRDTCEASEKIDAHKYENVDMKYLSMGMTNDYGLAIEEGSNIVRLGTAIFKESKN